MKRYRRALLLPWLLIPAYVVVSGLPVHATRFYYPEIFPIFTWGLFSRVTNDIDEFALVLLEVDGEVLEPPVEFREASHLVGGTVRSLNAHRTIQKIGAAVEAGDDASLARLRGTLEANFFGGREHVVYRLERHRSEPLERWRTGEVEVVGALATFESGTP